MPQTSSIAIQCSSDYDSPVYCNLTTKEMAFIQRRSCYRLFLDTMIVVLGFSTLISMCIAIFFFSGLNMLNLTTIVIVSVLMALGILFISIGTLFLINNIDQGISGILRDRLTEANKKIQELTDLNNTNSIPDPVQESSNP
ncbi:hypothetical protein BOKEGFJH_00350 [Chlamydia avium]|uniref:hypothetical protein n=1 Tax=Chlamydia avium TaxID=1457141 RepID=UPI0012BB1E77|nr:hypothetical protein [Chlamydia avium]VVT42834.1 hypothetical protein BOKEGFJH_00350 [Chlamydia avium]